VAHQEQRQLLVQLRQLVQVLEFQQQQVQGLVSEPNYHSHKLEQNVHLEYCLEKPWRVLVFQMRKRKFSIRR
jgi:hypothetical protein